MANLIERDKQKRKCYLTLFLKREKIKKVLKDRNQEIQGSNRIKQTIKKWIKSPFS